MASLGTNGEEVLDDLDGHPARSTGSLGDRPSIDTGRMSCCPPVGGKYSAEDNLVATGEAVAGSGFLRTGEVLDADETLALKAENEGALDAVEESCFCREDEGGFEEAKGVLGLECKPLCEGARSVAMAQAQLSSMSDNSSGAVTDTLPRRRNAVSGRIVYSETVLARKLAM
ncbi:MAG: hypothetical protein M1835_004540 [Candelina submexicana]|nr:MAG: hypothetical protein M1835_004540 [Candelina submexicana]